jgi:hypothetical protein
VSAAIASVPARHSAVAAASAVTPARSSRLRPLAALALAAPSAAVMAAE